MLKESPSKALPRAAQVCAGRDAWRTYHGADEDSIRWHLVEQYLPLLKSIVGRMRIYFPSHVDTDDLYSLGITGLITAVKRYDVSKAPSFGSYAALRIRGALLDELRRIDWLPRSHRAQVKRLRVVLNELEQRLRRPAREEEIAEAMGMSLKEYLRLTDMIRPLTFVSLDGGSNAECLENSSIHECLSDATEDNGREHCEKRELIRLIRERLTALDEIPKKVLILYYYKGLLLSEIAEILNLTESRICQIHAQAIFGLRVFIKETMHS
jgi:RNA polymerase sigma factor for flagellar operon FliA